MVNCRECWRAETPLWRRVLKGLDDLVFPPSPGQRLISAWGAVYLAGHGITRSSAYDRHKAEYEHTGDPMELERMLRHVKG